MSTHRRYFTIVHKDILYKWKLKTIEFITDVAMTINNWSNIVYHTIMNKLTLATSIFSSERLGLKCSQHAAVSWSHIKCSKFTSLVTDSGNVSDEKPVIWSSFRLCKFTISSGKLWRLAQPDISRKCSSLSFPIEAGISSNSAQELSLNTFKFSRFPISWGSIRKAMHLVILSFFKELISHSP